MADVELIIKIPEHCLEELKCVELNESNEGVVFHAVKCILNGIPHETVTEFADRCRECGREKVLDKISTEMEDAYEDLDGYDPDALPTYADRVSRIIDKYRKVKE